MMSVSTDFGTVVMIMAAHFIGSDQRCGRPSTADGSAQCRPVGGFPPKATHGAPLRSCSLWKPVLWNPVCRRHATTWRRNCFCVFHRTITLTTLLLATTLVRDQHVRSFQVCLVGSGGWEAWQHEDQRIVERQRHTDWQRVEQTLARFALEIEIWSSRVGASADDGRHPDHLRRRSVLQA